jgi:putative SbcD/Mre11-related phosphoesterase
MSRSRAELVQVEIEPGWWLSSGRSLFLAAEKTLVVADIHWGYADSHRRAGNLLPRWGNTETAERLRRLLDFYQPARMIWLGDSLHTASSTEAAEEFLAAHAPPEMVILRGNHDRKWGRITADTFRLGRCFFHHGDQEIAVDPGLTEIIGHIHPAISLGDGAGTRVRAPVLVHGRQRLIMPTFSDWSSGASWNGNLADGEKLWIISARAIWPLPARLRETKPSR